MKRNLTNLLEEAAARGASDLHIGAGMAPAIRVDGELTFLEGEPLTPEEAEALIRQALTPEQFQRLQSQGALDFSLTQGDARFRGNAFREMRGLSAALRLVPARIRSLEELGLPPVLRGVAQRRRGLFLVTGPAGQGKSATLAALVDEINRTRRAHVITIEDPIEYVHAPIRCVIHQREAGPGMRFADLLRSALRQDPDVILIGELRDLETISTAITAAATGHLVLGTLHTQDAAQSIERLIGAFPAQQQAQIRGQLALVLAGVCSQQLIPRARGGRVCASEILIATPAVRSCIREGREGQIQALIQTGAAFGMRTMEQCLTALVREGIITEDEALTWAYNPAELS